MGTATIDLSAPEFWAQTPEAKHAAFAELRREQPVSFWPETEWLVPNAPSRGNGYWAVTRYDDILHMSKNPEIWSSAEGISVGGTRPEAREFFGSMIVLDDPRHVRLRKLVSAGFTPRMTRRVEQIVAEVAASVVDDVLPRGECDFVTDIAAALPVRIICQMMGIPRSQEQYVFDQTNIMLGATDPEYVKAGTDANMATLGAAMGLAELMAELVPLKADGDADDLTTALVHAEIDGEKLTMQELKSFFILLVAAGNETTRNAISHGLWLLSLHPDQRAIWQSDFDRVASTAVDEIVRYASPVIFMRRTATRDTELRGTPIAKGDKALMFYFSANRDEAVFSDPDRFDVRRDPNHHIGFGGPGPHFCLGAHLARREISVMFRELFRRMPDLEPSGDPQFLLSSFIHGIKHLPCRYTPAAV